MSLTFQKRIENFTCEHCGARVSGSGFTNHCPVCLWGKHVDIYPGDRANECQGLMEPEQVTIGRDGYVIHHRCIKCGFVGTNKSAEGDEVGAFLDKQRGK